jgi:carbon dioxide concentrating mechanism protein CcmO
MVIPRPLEDLERTIPTASYWLEQALVIPEQEQKQQPLAIPLRLPQSVSVPLVEVEVVEVEIANTTEEFKSADNRSARDLE